MSTIKSQIDKYIKEREFSKAIKELNFIIEKDEDLLNCYILRGKVHFITEEHSKALNDYNKAIKLDPNNKLLASKIEMIKDILKFKALDIYSSTNLNLDPWLDD